ncbi:MAG: hypothetical protein PVG27_10040 [Chloroflexota bacterium]
MSPVRNASKALADVMQRSELRGAAAERERLTARAQARHRSAGHDAADFCVCPDRGCAALAEVLGPAPR